MANMLDNVAVRSIAKHRSKLMSLVESTKKRKKKKQKKWAVPPSNIEHLVFKKIPTSPIDTCPNFNGTRLDFSDDNVAEDYDGDEPEEESCDELDVVMVEEQCSMISSAGETPDHVSSHATLSLHLRTNHKSRKDSPTCVKDPIAGFKSKVIVVSGDDSGFSATDRNGGTCTTTTTTTFKSNVVNGKRSTNTILVRYKPGKSVSPDSEDELQFEFNNPKSDGLSSISSSPPSTLSCDSSSSKMDKTTTSAWAQIMELEGYRSPAIGLDNIALKHDDKNRSSSHDSVCTSLCCESHKNDLLSHNYNSKVNDVFPVQCSNAVHVASSHVSHIQPAVINSSVNLYVNNVSESECLESDRDSLSSSFGSSTIDCSVNYHPSSLSCNSLVSKKELVDSPRSKTSLQYHYGDDSIKDLSHSSLVHDQAKITPRYKSPMLRSESSRVPKVHLHERNKNRRKTLPDSSLSVSTVSSVKTQYSGLKSQKSPEHDPNASWGRYNSRAMRDSVRKVAEKYAETLYLRRQTRSKLDSLPEAKGVELNRYVSAVNNQDHVHSLKGLYMRNSLYSSRGRTNSTSHLHDISSESAPSYLKHQHSENFVRENSNRDIGLKCETCNNSCLNTSILNYNSFDKVARSTESFKVGESDETGSRFSQQYIHQNFQSTNSDKKTSRIAVSLAPVQSVAEASNHVHLSVNMREIKSKLCADCAQAAELGPPSKQSASRTKHQYLKSSHFHSSALDVSKRTPITGCDEDKSLCLYHRSFAEKMSEPHLKPEYSVNNSEKCTRLTAREMAELVHGKTVGKQNELKASQTGVTSKVSNWIQKQRDKRKPVFFIGDGPNFHSDGVTPFESNFKSKNRKSRRSLSLSSVRESDVSTSCNERTCSPLNILNTNSSESNDDKNLNHNENRGMFIKRTSSCCSNKGSTCRKDRHGSLVLGESDVAKNAASQSNLSNQVDECISSSIYEHNDKLKKYCESIQSNGLSDIPANFEECNSGVNQDCKVAATTKYASIFEKNSKLAKSFFSQKCDNLNTSKSSNYTNRQQNNELSSVDIYEDYSFDAQHQIFQNNPSAQLENTDHSGVYRNERLALAKKLLSIKQLTRALSLHSLKKRSKEESCENPVPSKNTSNLVKWTRGSKRKIENMKFGSLRKSLSYCELTIRDSKSSNKLPLQVKLEPKSKITVKPNLARAIHSSCSCSSSSLRRTVSLSWQFPLNRTIEQIPENVQDFALARLCFLRFHCKNLTLPFIREMRNKTHQGFKSHENGRSCVDGKQYTSRHSNHGSKPNKKLQTILDIWCFQERTLNGDKELLSGTNTMGLGYNPILNELDSRNKENMVEESMQFENASFESQTKLSGFMNKSKTPSVLRLRNKTTSRAERNAKGKSASELCDKILRRSERNIELKMRPKSQFYDIEEIETKTDDETNLIQQNFTDSSSQPLLNIIDQPCNKSESGSGMNLKTVSLYTSTPHLSPTDSLLQRFRKSFAVRFKKRTDSIPNNVNNATINSSHTNPESASSFQNYVANSSDNYHKINHHKHSESIDKCETNVSLEISLKKVNPISHVKEPLLLSSNSRRKTKRKHDWRRSLFYDSFDNIFDTNKLGVNKEHKMPPFTGSDANILRKRTASTSDYSPKSKTVQRPLSVIDSLSSDIPNSVKTSDPKNVAKTLSDTTYSEDHQKTVTSLDQIWRSNPVKLCRVHSRILMCRHKGRYRLRRSISQPVELEMSGSIHSLKESTHGSADHETFHKSNLSSDDEASSESDIYHSYCCSPTRRSTTCWELSGESAMYAEALWDHETLDSEELPFQAGDIIEVTDTSDQDWWWGIKDGQGGWFPSAFVRLYVSHRGPALHFNGQAAEEIAYSPSKVSMNNLSWEQVRANIVQEIVATERDYVKHLKDVVEGYLKQVQRRPDMFSKERIETVFGNIKEIYAFQSEFLKQLESCLDHDAPHLSQIGNCFLNHKEEFKMYSQYCNNHPLAVSELQELYCESQYIHFFEACRLLQEMIDISLDGFLLTPIQRICKYPLQLAELLKFTDENHPDHIPVTNAFAAMKEVAELVNERKRRMECLERLAEWQNTIEGWEGPDVLDNSSILIHCGEVTRVSSSWSRDIYLFIFDHQLIYCKKDLLKRHTYAYKGRLNLDHCDIVDVEDGKDSHFAVSVKNAWKIYCRGKDKWYLFYAKTAQEKEQWLRAFKAERQRVSDDEKQAFVVTEEAKRSARLAVQNKQKPKRPRAKFSKGRRCHPDVAVTELLLDSPSAKARSGSLPSNIHPELAILTGAKLGPTRKKGSGWFHFGSGKKPKS